MILVTSLCHLVIQSVISFSVVEMGFFPCVLNDNQVGHLLRYDEVSIIVVLERCFSVRIMEYHTVYRKLMIKINNLRQDLY